jgi:hypothetical protein
MRAEIVSHALSRGMTLPLLNYLYGNGRSAAPACASALTAARRRRSTEGRSTKDCGNAMNLLSRCGNKGGRVDRGAAAGRRGVPDRQTKGTMVHG